MYPDYEIQAAFDTDFSEAKSFRYIIISPCSFSMTIFYVSDIINPPITHFFFSLLLTIFSFLSKLVNKRYRINTIYLANFIIKIRFLLTIFLIITVWLIKKQININFILSHCNQKTSTPFIYYPIRILSALLISNDIPIFPKSSKQIQDFSFLLVFIHSIRQFIHKQNTYLLFICATKFTNIIKYHILIILVIKSFLFNIFSLLIIRFCKWCRNVQIPCSSFYQMIFAQMCQCFFEKILYGKCVLTILLFSSEHTLRRLLHSNNHSQ